MSRPSMFGGCIGRLWLIMTNFVLLFLTGLAMYTGYILLLNSRSYVGIVIPSNATMSETAVNAVKSVDIKDVGIIYGLATLFGLIGGCTGAIWFLTGYISLVGFALIVSVALGIFAVIKMNRNKATWGGLTPNDWSTFPPITKDFVQQTFGCCGWISNDQQAYTGAPTPFYTDRHNNTTSSAASTDNRCAARDISSIMGCHNASVEINSGMATLVTAILIIAIIFGLISMFAAHSARRREIYKEQQQQHQHQQHY
ncbi:hypothetical protein BSLG_001169 [Batrachochytrium salamandrivorans]|nr:hypothetical protein BSLG_001169 [Batrachochytrium salamandrivorans]